MSAIRNKGFLLTALFLVLLDQITKVAVKGFTLFGWHHQGMFLGESIPVFGDVLRISFVENAGMAFGITFGAGKIFLSLFSVIASIALAWYIARLDTQHFWLRTGLMLVLAGATGNLIDRVFYGVLYGEHPLFYGHVVDFIDVDMPDVTLFGHEYTRFWVFNVADSCVTTGMILLIFFNHHLPFLHHHSPHHSSSSTPNDRLTDSSSSANSSTKAA
jgi:signal peptidase II